MSEQKKQTTRSCQTFFSCNSCIELPDVGLMKFYQKMQRPFVAKAKQIERNLKYLEKEQRTEKSVEEVRKIHEKFSQVADYCIPRISGATGHQFRHQNFFLFVFLYQEISAVFNEAKTNPVPAGKPEFLTLDDLNAMISVGKNRLTLAYIGDAALESGVMASIWDPKTEKIPKAKFLNNEKKKLVDNKPLEKFWGSLHLYDSKIPIRHPDENDETKGSSMEAVFGIIYLEGGLEAVETSFINLRKYSEKGAA
jgi:23S rRNA maturation mini-RNase III